MQENTDRQNSVFGHFSRSGDHYPRKPIPAKIITTFLALILTLINFIFNSKFYLKIKGCAMETTCNL